MLGSWREIVQGLACGKWTFSVISAILIRRFRCDLEYVLPTLLWIAVLGSSIHDVVEIQWKILYVCCPAIELIDGGIRIRQSFFLWDSGSAGMFSIQIDSI